MRLLLLTHAFNSLAQRLWVELAAAGHALSLELDIADSVTEEAVALWQPDVVIARALPQAAHSGERVVDAAVPGGAPRPAGRPGPGGAGLGAAGRRHRVGRDGAASHR
jgi:putative two-component system hydrogenase maturation factor HypX/HoxX